jgi:hypothetical protein
MLISLPLWQWLLEKPQCYIIGTLHVLIFLRYEASLYVCAPGWLCAICHQIYDTWSHVRHRLNQNKREIKIEKYRGTPAHMTGFPIKIPLCVFGSEPRPSVFRRRHLIRPVRGWPWYLILCSTVVRFVVLCSTVVRLIVMSSTAVRFVVPRATVVL